MTPRVLPSLLLCTAFLCGASSAGAQEPHRIAGRVTDARSGGGLAGASVTLGGGPACARRTTMVADSSGRFAFPGLGGGRYCVTAAQPGYAPLTVTIELPGAVALGLALELQPIVLAELRVDTHVTRSASGMLPADVAADHDVAGANGGSWRALDAIVLGPQLPRVAAAGIAGSDVMRALRMQPGVDGADDFAARLWIRGADWSQTRVHFDGVPVFDPVHAAGIYATVRGDNGYAVLSSGAQRVQRSGGAASSIDFHTMPVMASSGTIEASLDGAALTAALARKRGGLRLALRSAWLSLLSERVARAQRDTAAHFPFYFHDLTTRGDVVLSERTHVEASMHAAADRVTTEPLLRQARAHSGAVVGRVSLVHHMRSTLLSVTAGASRYQGGISWTGGEMPDTLDPRFPEPLSPRLRQRHDVQQLAAQVRASGKVMWSAGASLERRALAYDGPVPVPAELGLPRALGWMDHASRRTYGAAWGDAVLPVQEALRVAIAARATGTGSEIRIDPRLTLRLQVGDAAVEMGAARTHQFEQGVGWAGTQIGPRLESALVTLPAGGAVPVVRADIITASSDVPIADGTVLRVRAYERRSSGHITRTPAAGVLTMSPPALGAALGDGWTVARENAKGLELGVTHTARSYDLELGYTVGSVIRRASGIRHAAPTDRRHAADALLVVRPLPALVLATRLEAGTGTPYRRFQPCAATCESFALGVVSRADAARTAGYRRLDISATWQRRFHQLEFQLGVGAINIFAAQNALIYTGTSMDGVDHFAAGWPRTLTSFVRIGF